MLGGLVGDNLSEPEKAKLQSAAAWLKPEEVSVWQIKDDGTLISIKDKRTGTIGKHYFNEVMNSVMNEYYALLKHLNVTK
jgi:hypothetical protein